MAISACVSLGLAISIRSISGRSTSVRQSVSADAVAPLFGERGDLGGVARADGLQQRTVWQVEELVDSREGVRMRAAHEAVADKADPQWLLRHGLLTASRGHRARRSWWPGCPFQVRGSIITALGNMQPSQQMCRTARVSCPSLVAQPVAGVAHDVELAVGVVRQAMVAGLVVRARAIHRGVVLRHVEIDGPGPQRRGQCRAGPRRSRAGPIQSKSVGQDAVLRARCSPACTAACAPCPPGSPASWAGPPFRAVRTICASYACRPSRSRLRRPAARR